MSETREGWPADLLFLLERYPRAQWAEGRLGELAQFWLHKHASLRVLGARIAGDSAAWRAGEMPAAQFQSVFPLALGRLLGDLHGHHQVEDQHYFPAFRAAESRLLRGFEVLENDHATTHARIVAAAETGTAFHRAQGVALAATAEAYAAASDALVGGLDRHLTDEEDLVIPLITDRGW